MITETDLNELRACIADLRTFIETIPNLSTSQVARKAGGILNQTRDAALKYNCYREDNKAGEMIPFFNIRLFTDDELKFYRKKIKMLERERKKNEDNLLEYNRILAEIDGLIHQDL